MSASLVLPRPVLTWQLRNRTVEVGRRTLLLGILNCTPDSFSDGGQHQTVDDAVRHGLLLLEQGADALDLGAESTRPGAMPISSDVEQQRLLSVLQQLRQLRPESILSIDTYHASTAAAALVCGADVVNDVSGLHWDTAMPATLASAKPIPGAILMHARGTPQTWSQLPQLQPAEVLETVLTGLAESLVRAARAGLPEATLAIDPGFGFGKRGAENLPLLLWLAELHRFGRPVVVGLSRKGFLVPTGNLTADALSPERQRATDAAHTAAILAGAHLLRVHDVRAAVTVASLADRLRDAR